jgi:hypothetical protein
MALDVVTVGQILYQGFRYAGILRGPMRGLSGSEQQEGVMFLNALLDSMEAERGSIYAITNNTVNIYANQQQYKIGLDLSTGVLPDWQLPRPETIPRAGFIWTNTNPPIEEPFEMYTDQQWAALSPKLLQSNIPYVMYYQPFTPLGIVNIWPIPTSNWQAILYLWQSISQVSDPTVTLYMPAGYNDVLSYGLALRLAPAYPQFPQHAWVMQAYLNAKSRIRARNWTPLLMQSELGARQFNYQQGSRYDPIANRYR